MINGGCWQVRFLVQLVTLLMIGDTLELASFSWVAVEVPARFQLDCTVLCKCREYNQYYEYIFCLFAPKIDQFFVVGQAGDSLNQ